jgi:hypothetical protein
MSEVQSPTAAGLTYDVAEVEPQGAERELTQLWRENLPVAGDLYRKLRWFYLEAPTGPARAFLLHPRSSGASAVGTAGAGVRAFAVGSVALEAALVADLAVASAHRSVFPALSLVRSVRGAVLERFPLAYGFPNTSAEPVFRRAGYELLGRMTRYVRVLRHRAHLERRLDLGSISGAAAAILDRTRLGAVQMRVARQRGRLAWVNGFDTRFDRLWQIAQGDFDIVAQRDAAFLKWRFLEHPSDAFRIASLIGSQGQLDAYAIVEQEGSMLHVRDLFGRSRALGPLLDQLALAGWHEGAASLSMRHLGSGSFVRVLRERGFWPREQVRAVVVARAERAADSELLDPGRWHLTDADEDF